VEELGAARRDGRGMVSDHSLGAQKNLFRKETKPEAGKGKKGGDVVEEKLLS